MDANEVVEKVDILQSYPEELLKYLISVRNECAKSPKNQLAIASNDTLHKYFITILSTNDDSFKQVKKILWQLIANTIVNNHEAQALMWSRYGEYLINLFNTTCLDENTNVQLMIVYNILLGRTGVITEKLAFTMVVQVWNAVLQQKCTLDFDFLHFIFERFLVEKGRETIGYYEQLPADDRLIFLDYLASYLTHDSPNGRVHTFILQHLAKQFKIKSDCILGPNSERVNAVHPREVHYILRILASATGSENYANIFTNDHALFLNVSSLLRCLAAASKETKNIFTPMAKLEEVAPTSRISTEFETEISFEMKTLLVRCVANLLYKNKVNQGYCIDTQLMPVLLECTNMDARNPLMKEWSILAIRNACYDCPQIQSIIANLTKQGEAPNDLLSELNLEMGALRISGK